MDKRNIVKDTELEEHFIEEYHFSTLYDDKNSDMEDNNLSIIATKNDLIKEHKKKFHEATKHLIMSKRENRDVEIKEHANKSSNTNTPSTSNVPSDAPISNQEENIITSNLSIIEKKISDKIDTSLNIINALKTSIDNISTNSQTSEGISDEEKQTSYKKGFDDGIQQTIENFKVDYEKDRERLQSTLSNIANYIERSDSILNSLENELSKASINIANEVIAREVENDSGKVALHLAKTLINEIKEAGNISLKVSPYDFDFIKSNLEHPNIEIINDISVAKGGIIILSDIENIDGSISQRLGNIKLSLES